MKSMRKARAESQAAARAAREEEERLERLRQFEIAEEEEVALLDGQMQWLGYEQEEREDRCLEMDDDQEEEEDWFLEEREDPNEGDTDAEEDSLDFNTNAFEILLSSASASSSTAPSASIARYQRGPEPSKRTLKRHEEDKIARINSVIDSKTGKRLTNTMTDFFKVSESVRPSYPTPLRLDPPQEAPKSGEQDAQGPDRHLPLPTLSELSKAIEDLERRYHKRFGLQGQNRQRHDAVLAFLKAQRSGLDEHGIKTEDRIEVAEKVARYGFDRGIAYARKIVSWEIEWRRFRQIPEGRKGCFAKTRSWFNDEGTQLAAREYLQSAGEAISAFGLSKAVGEYLSSAQAADSLHTLFTDTNPISIGNGKAKESARSAIRVRTARNWLRRMGLKSQKVTKHIYFDGHERKDVVEYRNDKFLPEWEKYKPRMAIFSEDGTWKYPEGLDASKEVIIPLAHDESIYHANDGRRRVWAREGKLPIRPKNQGKGIMVSGLITPAGVLKVPDSISDAELLSDPTFPRHPATTGKNPQPERPIRTSMHLHEYGKENGYWTSSMMIDHIIRIALPIFRKAFPPNARALFCFDNASNHCAFAANALVASRLSRDPGGKQPKMVDAWDHRKGRPQPMQFGQTLDWDDPNYKFRGQPKGAARFLKERGLYKDRIQGRKIVLQCSKTGGRAGCDLEGGYCMRTIIAAEPAFRDQKGKLEEEIVGANQYVIFFPKFHCELNWIERFWCASKHYTRNHCSYDIKGLREAIPASFDSISPASILRYYHHCMDTMRAYQDKGLKYGTAEFAKRLVQYKGHRQIRDSTKD